MSDFIARSKKAIAGAVAGGTAMFVKVVPDGITIDEWGQVAGAIVVGGLVVWFAPANKESDGAGRHEA